MRRLLSMIVGAVVPLRLYSDAQIQREVNRREQRARQRKAHRDYLDANGIGRRQTTLW